MSEMMSRLQALQMGLQALAMPAAPHEIPPLDNDVNGAQALATSLEECAEALRRVETSIVRLQERPKQMLEELQAHGSNLEEGVNRLFGAVREDLKDAHGALEGFGERVPETIREKWEGLGGTVNDLQDDMVAKAEELWRDAVNEATDEWQEGMEEVLDEQMERFTGAADLAKDALEQALEELKEFAEVRLTDTVKEEARKLLETALEKLRQEVMDGVVTSQIQTQLTTAMSPFLPQLMAVRAVASAIKQALEILRMGF